MLPVAVAQALIHVEIDGRPAHEVGLAYARLACGPRTVIAFERSPGRTRMVHGQVLVAPDDRGTSFRRGVVEGEGPVLLRQTASLAQRGRTLEVTSADGAPQLRGKTVLLRSDQRVVVR